MSNQFNGIDLNPITHLIALMSEPVIPERLSMKIGDDPDDDKFLACALAGKVKFVASGDNRLLKVSGSKTSLSHPATAEYFRWHLPSSAFLSRMVMSGSMVGFSSEVSWLMWFVPAIQDILHCPGDMGYHLHHL